MNDFITPEDVRRAGAWFVSYLQSDAEGRRILEESRPIKAKALADVVTSSLGLYLDPDAAATKVQTHLMALTLVGYDIDADGDP